MKAKINISDLQNGESTKYTETFKIAISGTKERIKTILNVSFFDSVDIALKVAQGQKVSKLEYKHTRAILRDICNINIKDLVIHNPKK